MTPYSLAWLAAFVWTLAVEVPIYVFVLRRGGQRTRRAVLACLGINAITHPALWFVAPRFGPDWAWMVSMEACVWVAEAVALSLLLARWGSPDARLAIRAAVCANAASTAVGLLVQAGDVSTLG